MILICRLAVLALLLASLGCGREDESLIGLKGGALDPFAKAPAPTLPRLYDGRSLSSWLQQSGSSLASVREPAA